LVIGFCDLEFGIWNLEFIMMQLNRVVAQQDRILAWILTELKLLCNNFSITVVLIYNVISTGVKWSGEIFLTIRGIKSQGKP
jgi:hypothetical protein